MSQEQGKGADSGSGRDQAQVNPVRGDWLLSGLAAGPRLYKKCKTKRRLKAAPGIKIP